LIIYTVNVLNIQTHISILQLWHMHVASLQLSAV